jgi:ATP-dependent RNA helicase RhlE
MPIKGEPMNFNELPLHRVIQSSIIENGYLEPTPIQEHAIPIILDGHDLIATAQTGTGKTAAFALPLIDKYHRNYKPGQKRKIQTLVLAPTRELAEQIKENFVSYSRKTSVNALAIYGGVSKHHQIIKIKRGVNVLIATPGRLLDLMDMRIVSLKDVETVILDEVDQMLDMGFIHDVKKIMKETPKERQTLVFSATLPKELEELSKSLLTNPKRLEMAPQNTPLETINQKVFFLKNDDKLDTLIHLFKNEPFKKTLIFTRTKRFADKLFVMLKKHNIHSGVLHGDKSQGQRQATLRQFKTDKLNLLIATDVAARGIDISELSHVINFDMPETPETYLHRIGRTARAGALGSAYSFCPSDQKHLLKAIQNHIGFTLPIEKNHPYHLQMTLSSNTNYKSTPKRKRTRSRKPRYA